MMMGWCEENGTMVRWRSCNYNDTRVQQCNGVGAIVQCHDGQILMKQCPIAPLLLGESTINFLAYVQQHYSVKSSVDMIYIYQLNQASCMLVLNALYFYAFHLQLLLFRFEDRCNYSRIMEIKSLYNVWNAPLPISLPGVSHHIHNTYLFRIISRQKNIKHLKLFWKFYIINEENKLFGNIVQSNIYSNFYDSMPNE